jgi:hypothetical protein
MRDFQVRASFILSNHSAMQRAEQLCRVGTVSRQYFFRKDTEKIEQTAPVFARPKLRALFEKLAKPPVYGGLALIVFCPDGRKF